MTRDKAPRVMQLTTDVRSTTAQMTIYGDIAQTDWLAIFMGGDGDGTTTNALDVSKAIAAIPPEVTDIEVHINSYGGDVAEGVAIYNALRQSGKHVTTVCDGFACSIASVIFMAGERRVMNSASLLMLHEPSFPNAGGNAKALRKQADDLDVISQLSKTAYLAPGGIEPEELDEVMSAETWVSPEQAVEWKLATDIADDADNAEPTQSARESVALALMCKGEQSPQQAAPVVDVDAIAQRVVELMDERAEQASAAQPAQSAEQAPEPTTETAPTLPEGGYARYSAIANEEQGA
ncbi:head maturation protease, ClpP-related [Olsenella sp. AM39-30AC]|uniref:head maturation protease, ClpP-related n=1 Tax=Olsenella sp. AM39-30AC TaxID=2292360 RepID=UPI0013146DCB|nr:head maturation protease, ClpP-related [Olsenella sp. AM39-30AC]